MHHRPSLALDCGHHTKRENDAPFLLFTSEITVGWTIEMAGDKFVRVIASHRMQIFQ